MTDSYKPKARTITIPEFLDSDFHEWQMLKQQLCDGTPLTELAREVLDIKLANAERGLLLDLESLINDSKS